MNRDDIPQAPDVGAPPTRWLDRPLSGKRVSYIMTTLNKLSYLRLTVPRVLAALAPDEEFVVVDGGSRDGSREYLAERRQSGAIAWYVSERDLGEAHALNKAMLAARGRFITVLTDDDVFDFGVLRRLHAYLDARPGVSVVFPSGADTAWDEEPFVRAGPSNDVLLQRADIERRGQLCLMSGLGLTFRREALPEIGLFDLNFKRVDLAFSCRLTASPVCIAGFSLYGYVRILNEQSLTCAMGTRNYEEKRRLLDFYSGGGAVCGRALLAALVARARERWFGARGEDDELAARLMSTARVPRTPEERVRIAAAWLETANAGRPERFVERAGNRLNDGNDGRAATTKEGGHEEG